MKLSTHNNIHNHIALLSCQNVNHIAEQDWTAEELEAFADFVRDIAALHGQMRIAGEMYRDYKFYLARYSETVKFATLEELENPNSEYIDNQFWVVKLAVEDMAAELVLYSGAHEYFSDAYAD